ncbi:hypothetical protein C4K23_3219 [Pseudomonas chlororaphis]|nr:hypothetical protein C4K23_3219 [Pseudomonas chlororaphis]AZE11602.1 hypothetical protein C4K10_3322 [Pseudomonas chlororaphis subsp. aureofaciens]
MRSAKAGPEGENQASILGKKRKHLLPTLCPF